MTLDSETPAVESSATIMPDEDGSKKDESSLGAAKPSVRKLFKTAKPEIPMLLFSIVLMIASESSQMVIPLVLANAYGKVFNI
jgi:hypothetical protein